MNKLQTLIAATVLMTGLAAAQPSDLPDAGITPGDLFYGLERASEALELAVASAPVIGSDELAAKVRANHAAERLAEAKKLSEENRPEKVEQLMEEYSRTMNRSVEQAQKSGNPELASRLKDVSGNQVKVLQDVKTRVPESAREGIDKAIENSQRHQQKLDLAAEASDRGRKGGSGNAGGVNVSVEESVPANPEERQGPEEATENVTENLSENLENGNMTGENLENGTNSSGETITGGFSETAAEKLGGNGLP